jgi:hypothetical protein
MNKIISVAYVTSEDPEYDGALIAVHADGQLSRVQVGHDDKGLCYKVTPLPEVIPS